MKTGLVAFAFGVPYSTTANREIARIVTECASENPMPVFTQKDIQINLAGLDIAMCAEAEQSPPTLRIARASVKWAQKKELKQLKIIAAVPHVWRCKRDLEAAVLESGAKINVSIIESIYEVESSLWFDPNGVQRRAQSWSKWWWASHRNELLLRAIPFSIYRHIAN